MSRDRVRIMSWVVGVFIIGCVTIGISFVGADEAGDAQATSSVGDGSNLVAGKRTEKIYVSLEGNGNGDFIRTAREWSENGKNEASVLLKVLQSGDGEFSIGDDVLDDFVNKAENGDVEMQAILGMCYYVGRGVPVDYDKAVKWLKMAGENGNSEAQFALIGCYIEGKTKDEVKALKWMERAAGNGVIEAMPMAGYYYEKGIGTDADDGKAEYWYKLGAERGEVKSQVLLARFYDNRNNSRKAYKWYMKAAVQGEAEAQVKIGEYYRQGVGGRIDYVEALKWHSLAAEQGNCYSQLFLAVMYIMGEGVEKNYEKAIELLKLSSKQGYREAKGLLGSLYLNKDIGKVDYAEAYTLLLDAAEDNLSGAQVCLGIMFEKGLGRDVDLEEAKKWYRLAADQGKTVAKERLKVLSAME